MKNLERYVFGSFLSSFFLAFLVLSFVLTIGVMVQIVGYILQGVPINLVGRFALVSFPETMQWTVPLSLLVSSILVFSRLSADSEIAAMRACGVNLLTVMRWPLAFAFLCTCLCLFVNNEIVPRGHEVRRNLQGQVAKDAGLEVLEPGRTITDFKNVLLYFREHGASSNSLLGVMVDDNRDPQCPRFIKAKQAVVRQDGRNLVLEARDISMYPVAPNYLKTVQSESASWNLSDVLKGGEYKRKEKDFRFFEMVSAISKAKANVANAKGTSKKGTARYLAKRHLSDIQTEFQKRWVFAFASICFVLVGAPLGIQAQRKESSIGMAISLGVALSYYMVIILMSSLSKNFRAQPEFLIWLPVLACILLASYLVPKNL